MEKNVKISGLIKKTIKDQLFGILATQGREFPHTTIVSFISADNLKSIIFFTPKATRKLKFLSRSGGVSFFIDNRSNRIADLQTVAGIEAQGNAVEIPEKERAGYEELYLNKYPELEDFVRSPGNAMIRIDVVTYNIVQHFQEVTILEIRKNDI
jgi:nitroimidazol reductase NimA-like FMN-containing flavoprotein (pyridoxamine 5'-phosphate oxidase superfamily)